MKKLLLLFILTLACSINSKSQTRSGLGVHVGIMKVGTYNDRTMPSAEQKKANGLQLGFRYNLKIGPIGFSPELNVVNFKFNYDAETPGIDNSRYYLSLPLLLKWYLGPLNLYAGPQFSYLVGGRWDSDECVLDQCIELEKDGEIEEIDIYRKLDFSSIIGLGLDTKIGVYVSLRAAISLVPIESENFLDYYVGSGARYLSGQFFMGYRF